jgi:O-antigen/teichoic acid export membrane protein
MSRVKSSSYNVATIGLFAVVTTSLGLISTPLLLLWLGKEQFGLFRMLADWAGYVTILDLGLGASVGACIAWALEQPPEMLEKVLATSVRAYLKITALMMAGALAFVVALPKLMPVSSVSNWQISVAAAVLFLPLAWTPITTFRALAEARQKGYLINLMLAGQAVLTTLLVLILAKLGFGVVGQAIGTTVAQLPLPIALAAFAIRKYRGLWSRPFDQETAKKLRRSNGPNLILNLSGRLSLLSDNIVIGTVMGSAAVAPFFLTQRLASLAQSQLLGVGSSTWPALMQLHNRGMKMLFCTRLKQLTSLLSSLSLAALAPIVAFNGHFISQWVGKAAYAGEAVNMVSCVNIWFGCLLSLWLWPIVASGNSVLWAPFAIVATVINVAVSILGAIYFGWLGPLLGTLISYCIVSSWAVPRIVRDLFEIRPSDIWYSALSPLLWAVPYTLILCLISARSLASGWVGVAIEMGISACGALGIYWLIGMNSEQRSEWVVRARATLAA